MCATTAGLLAWAFVERAGLPIAQAPPEPVGAGPFANVPPEDAVEPSAAAPYPEASVDSDDVEARVRERLYGASGRRR